MTAADDGSARWRHLGVSLVGLVAACALQNGLPFLTVAFRAEGLSLAAIGLLVSAPTAGLVLSLLAWGAAADRYGERLVLSAGLGTAATAMTGAALAGTPVATGLWLLLAGAGSASVHAASGRLVLGWFPASQRGLAMGIRQAGQAHRGAEIDDGQKRVAEPEEGGAVDALEHVLRARPHAYQLLDRDLGNGEPLAAAADDQRGQDDEGEGQLDLEFVSVAISLNAALCADIIGALFRELHHIKVA